VEQSLNEIRHTIMRHNLEQQAQARRSQGGSSEFRDEAKSVKSALQRPNQDNFSKFSTIQSQRTKRVSFMMPVNIESGGHPAQQS